MRVWRIEGYRWCFFFFSSRRRHTRYWRDWSSDVCSSDLYPKFVYGQDNARFIGGDVVATVRPIESLTLSAKGEWISARNLRSEERRVGKECRSRWSPYH